MENKVIVFENIMKKSTKHLLIYGWLGGRTFFVGGRAVVEMEIIRGKSSNVIFFTSQRVPASPWIKRKI